MTSEHWHGKVVAFPRDVASRYRDEGLWGDRTIADEFHSVAKAHAGAPAVITLTERLDYGELDLRSDRLAANLLARGLTPGQRAILQVDNRADTVIVWYALLKAGLIPVATLPMHRHHEIDAIAAQTGAALHVVIADHPGFDFPSFARRIAADHPQLRHIVTVGAASASPGTLRAEDLQREGDPIAARRTVEAVQRDIDPDDVAVFQLSGGTTGTPKVIPRMHAEYWYNGRAYAQALGFDSACRVAHVIPVIHNAGVTCGLHAAHSAGAAIVLGVIGDTLRLVAEAEATDIILISNFMAQLRHAPGFRDAMTSLRRIVLSATAVDPEVFDLLEGMGIRVAQLFGMAEGPFLVAGPGLPEEVRRRTVGAPLSTLDEVRLLRPGSEREVDFGEIGELAFQGACTTRGYYGADEHNALAFTTDGLLRTGDLAREHLIDGVRCWSIEGRIKDVINRGGEKVNAGEVETLLTRHPRIKAAAVVAMPDPRLIERACAYLVADGEPPDLAEVRAFLKDLGVARFKWPERVEHLDALPATAVGKLAKAELRADIAAKLERERGGRPTISPS